MATMRPIIVLATCLACVCSANAVEPGSKGAQARALAGKPVALAVVTDQGDYGRTDNARVRVRLKNATTARLYVRRQAGWGESSSVSIWIVDAASGRNVNSRFLADDIDPPVDNDAQLAALEAGAEISWNFDLPLAQYPLQPGHSYRVLVQYHSKRPIVAGTGGVRTVTGPLAAEASSAPFVVR